MSNYPVEFRLKRQVAAAGFEQSLFTGKFQVYRLILGAELAVLVIAVIIRTKRL